VRGASSQWSKHVLHGGVEFEVLQHGDQLPLFVAEVVLHDRCHAFEVTIQFFRGCRSIERIAQPLEKMRDHRMVLFERAQDGREVRMRSFDGGKQSAVLALMMPVECGAESMTIKQQVTARVLARCPIAHSLSCDLQSIADACVPPAELSAPGYEPGRLALSQARTEKRDENIVDSFGSAPPCLTRTATSTRRCPDANRPRSEGDFARRSLRCFVSTLSSKWASRKMVDRFGGRVGIVRWSVTSRLEVRPMNAVAQWVLPLPVVTGGRLT